MLHSQGEFFLLYEHFISQRMYRVYGLGVYVIDSFRIQRRSNIWRLICEIGAIVHESILQINISRSLLAHF